MTKLIEQYLQKRWILTISFDRASGSYTMNIGVCLVHGKTIDECWSKLDTEIQKNGCVGT